jgi:hypothetical protein
MTFPKDENGRYWIPAESHEPRVEMDCDCGYSLNCPERVWDYVSGQHAAAHQKGLDGLSAGASWDIRHLDAADGTKPSGPQPEAEAEAPPATAADVLAVLRSEVTGAEADGVLASYFEPSAAPRYDTPQARAEAEAEAG